MSYLPGPDAAFQAWVNNFVTYANANLAALGIVAGDLAPVQAAQTVFDTDFASHIAAKAAAQSAKQAKDDSRRELTAEIRPLVRRLQASPSVDDAERAALGITVPGGGGPVPAPSTRPLVAIECGQRLQHSLRFVDEATPTRRGKPEGAIGVEIWNKVGGTPPADESELRFQFVDTNSPATVTYTGSQGGQNAYYWCRWVTATGLRGPWSETAVATIAA